MVDTRNNRRPDETVTGIDGRMWFAPNAEHSSDRFLHGFAIARKQNDSWSAMAWYVRSGCIDDVRKIPVWEVLLNQLFPEFALHEGVRRNHAYIPGGLCCTFLGCHSKVEEPFHERDCQ